MPFGVGWGRVRGVPPSKRNVGRSRAMPVLQTPGVLSEEERRERDAAFKRAGMLPVRGRPKGWVKHPPDDPKWVVFRTLLRYGMTKTRALAEIRVTPPTFAAYERLAEKDPEWAEWKALNDTAALGPEKVCLQTLYRFARKEPGTAERVLKLVYRDRYAERTETTHTVKAEPTLDLAKLTDQEVETYWQLRAKMEKPPEILPLNATQSFPLEDGEDDDSDDQG